MKKLLAVLVLATLAISLYSIATPATASGTSLPDYKPVDWRSGLAGKIRTPEVTSAASGLQPVVAVSNPSQYVRAYDWYLEALTGDPWLDLRYNSDYVEIWVAENLSFPVGDPRNTDPNDLLITDQMCTWLGDEFNNLIYSTDTGTFGKPFDRDGTNTIFELIGLPSFNSDYYSWIRTSNPQRVILKVLNIQDENYYNATYPYYTVGFYDPTYTISYYNRNMIQVDAWRWWERLGPEGTQWIPGHNVTRPHVIESTVAHEYQHDIHQDWQPADDLFMNEGCSMYAELLCGYGIETNYLNSYFATPDNSLTVWSDQGDINILADYGAAALWTVYLTDHYGGTNFISYYMEEGIPSIDGINNALSHFKYKANFLSVYHDWRLANLIRSNYPGCGKYNYKSLNLNDPSIIPVRTYVERGLPVPWTNGTDFGITRTILNYSTGVSELGPFGTDYIAFTDWKRPGVIYFDGDNTAIYGWTYNATGGYWWSDGENLMNTLLVGQASIPTTTPILNIDTRYDIENWWDFGFVQVSTDNGATWTSLPNEYTNDTVNPYGHPAVFANLPGLTGLSPDWPGWTSTTMLFDLSEYAGQDVLIGFRYMTDWAVLGKGWFIKSASINGVPLTLTPVYPKADFQVTLVYAYIYHRQTFYFPIDMWLNAKTETGFGIAFLDKPSYVIMVVSPTMLHGWVDYRFRATTFSFCHGGYWMKSC
jgi:immune inhibitor A